ncbi:MAG: hypothetical protein NTX64_17515 [Elusimicrobia bacterium]|nr:hypothetical protein [Elusimicrobiota bacterium]
MVAALALSASLALATESVQLLGPVSLTASRPHGHTTVVVTLYDGPEHGRVVWRSPPIKAWANNFQWTFTGVLGPAADARLQDFPPNVFAEFRSGDMSLRPLEQKGLRQLFHGTMSSTAERLVFEPGLPKEAASLPGLAADHGAARSRTRHRPSDPEEDGVDTGSGERPTLLAREPAAANAPFSPPAQPRSTASANGRLQVRDAAPRTPTLDDLKLSNSLYFQALRDFQTGNMGLAVRKLDVALSLNPANSDARLALERILQEAAPAAQASAAPRPPEAATQAQDLYFQALREYAKGRVQRSRDALIRASQLDPTDRGIAAALLHLRRELALVPSDGIH